MSSEELRQKATQLITEGEEYRFHFLKAVQT